MRVKAKFNNRKFGFYGGIRRYNGDVFELTDPKHFSANWMVKDEKAKRQKPEELKNDGAE